MLDAVGKLTFGAAKRWLGPEGVYLSSELGPYWQNPPLALMTPVLPGPDVVFPTPLEGDDVMVDLVERLARGSFRPVLDPHRFRLDDIVDAYRYVESGQKLGSVVLEVTRSGA